MSEHIVGSDLYTIQFEYRPEFLVATVCGESDSLEISLQFWSHIHKEVRKHGYKSVLVLENLQNTIGTFDTYLLNQQLGQMGFFNIRIAFVDAFPDQSDINQFGETVAINRGLVLKVFLCKEEAEQWLLAK